MASIQTLGRPTRSRTTRTGVKNDEIENLAAQVSSKLTITATKKATSIQTTRRQVKTVAYNVPDDVKSRCTSALRTVNSCMQALSDAVKTQDSSRSTAATRLDSSVKAVIANAKSSLSELRTINSGTLDYEKAAISIVGKLVRLNMFSEALGFVQDSHQPLLSFLGPSLSEEKPIEVAPMSQSSPISRLLHPPIPLNVESNIQTLLLSHFSFALISAAHCITPTSLSFTEFQNSLPRFTHFYRHMALSSSVPRTTTDSMLKRGYMVINSTLTNQASDAAILLSCRFQTLRWLLFSSDLNSDMFWDQVLRFTASTVKLQLSSDNSEACTSLRSTLEALLCIVEEVEGIVPHIMVGNKWISLCEYWISLGKKVGDIRTLNDVSRRIQQIASTSSGTSLEATSQTTPIRSDSSLLEMTRLSAVFSQTTLQLENCTNSRNDGGLQQLFDSLNASSTALGCCTDLLRISSQVISSTEKKVRASIDKLRRASIEALSHKSLSRSVRDGCISLLEKLVQVLSEVSLAADIWRVDVYDLITYSLDSLFQLSSHTASVSQMESFDQAFQWLVVADDIVKKLLNSAVMSSSLSNLKEAANYARCVSGAFHNASGLLFKAEKYAHSIRFLREACRIADDALQLKSRYEEACKNQKGKERSGDTEEDARSTKAWQLLPIQLSKRWELLGVCHSKCGDRKAAYESMVNSLKYFPFGGPFTETIRGDPFVNVFEIVEFQFLGPLIDRVTYIGFSDLLLGREASLLKPLLASAVPPLCIGAILQRQIDSLRSSRWKPAIQDSLLNLLDDLLTIYGDDYPIQQAKVIILCLEHSLYCGKSRISFKELGNRAVALLSIKDLSQDKRLAYLGPQYLASVQLLLALHERQWNQDDAAMMRHLQGAFKTLQSIVTTPSKPTFSRETRPKANENKIMKELSLNKTIPVRSSAKSRAVKKKVPVTPTQNEKFLEEVVSSRDITQSEPGVQNIDNLLDLLNLTSALLGLLGRPMENLQLLFLSRALSEKYLGLSSEGWLWSSTELAHVLAQIGKLEHAKAIYVNVLEAQNGSSNSSMRKLLGLAKLRYAEVLALLGAVEISAELYEAVLKSSEDLVMEASDSSTFSRVRSRIDTLEMVAVACNTYASIQSAKDDPVAALEGYLQALRILNRMTDLIEKLNPASSTSTGSPAPESNPFVVTELNSTPVPSSGPSLQTAKPPRVSSDGMEWRISKQLITTLSAISHCYAIRGSPREAEYFSQQAQTLANCVATPAYAGSTILFNSDLKLRLGEVDSGFKLLLEAYDRLKDLEGVEAVAARGLKGTYSTHTLQVEEASALYDEALQILLSMEQQFAQVVSSELSTAKTPASQEQLAPVLLSSILRKQLWLLRDERDERYEQISERLIALPDLPDVQANVNAIMSALSMNDIHELFRTDIFLSSLAESTISLPMGMSVDKASVVSTQVQEVVDSLTEAESLFATGLQSFGRQGSVVHVRHSALSLAIMRAFQTSLGNSVKFSPVLASNLLDLASSVALQREYIDAIQRKYLSSRDDMIWPSLEKVTQAVPMRKHLKDSIDVEPLDLSTPSERAMEAFWKSVYEKRKSLTFDVESLSQSQIEQLPKNWVVIHVNVTDDKSTLMISRQQRDHEPLVFFVPLKGRRDEEEEHFTFDDAINELKDIIAVSDEGTRKASDIRSDDRDGKAAWWAERKKLDLRLKELLENIEFCWLGGFKTILGQPMEFPLDAIQSLRTRFEKLFKQIVGPHQKKSKTKFKLEQSLIESFAILPPTCRDEELEDLIYFILDMYHFHGVPIALAEIDVDHMVVDLRTMLEEHRAKTKDKVSPVPDSHMFLVLGKGVQSIPWESIPILRGHSVSRIPSVSFLTERLEMAAIQRSASQNTGGNGPELLIDRAVINPCKTYFVLNPGGDLSGTEGRFNDWVKKMKNVGWSGLIGEKPSEMQFLNALSQKDLVLYFGHGGAEQYVRSHKIRHLPRCAATMLWGCSSGALRDMGEFDPTGTPYNYMIAGCPSLVANLWDVTDRDIDKFATSVFEKLHLEVDEVSKWRDGRGRSGGGTSVVAAIAQSREVCKLKYLTGAAPIVYGIPFYI